MNARQKAKKLKKEMKMLKSDNDLMRRIIGDSSLMQELYDAYNRPIKTIYSTMHFQEYRARRIIPVYMDSGVIEPAKRAVAMDLLEAIKENITYEVGIEGMSATITASGFIGYKE